MDSHRRPLQRNAADPKQIRYAERKAQEEEARYLDALRATLQTPAGRIVCWGLLTRAGIYRSIWDSSAKIHYNAGKQDFGHELLASLIAADAVAYVRMEQEERAHARRIERESAGVQTPPADEDTGA